MLVVENFAMAACPMIAGQIIEHSPTKQIGYRNSSLFYSILGVVGVLTSFLLFCISDRDKKLLDGTSLEKKLTAVQIQMYYSDGEHPMYRATSEPSGLDVRLIKSYDFVDFTK
jgi:hypothetical protein